MIPILYENTETTFRSNGIGRLADCLSCTVTEERNGVYECQFQYPITGQHYDDIIEGMIIGVIHDDRKDIQPFDIYKRTAPINGIVTFYAHHISYRLGNIILNPFNTHSAVQTMNAFVNNSMNPNPFTFWTDKETTGEFSVDVPISNKAVLGGMQGSVLDVYGGGEYQWDVWTVRLYQNRGTNTDVEIRYGKNLTDIRYDYDTTDVYTAVAPYWKAQGEDDTIVVLPEGYIKASEPNYTRIRPLDLSSVWRDAPTVTQLRNEATRRLNVGRPWVPKESIKVNFVALWQTEEYASVAPLQRVSLCDTVRIIYPTMGVNATAKVIKVVYNVLLERYNSMELGDAKTSFRDALFADLQTSWLKSVPTSSMMQAAIDRATELISGGLGGHVVINTNADGQPNEILIMDTEDISTAVKVLRINQNGIGFSSNGYEGPFRTAWTLDGHFVADFITSGNMNANLITTGVITDRNGRNYWNLDTGEISISIEHGEEGEVTQADLARVQNNAQQYANSAEAAAKDYADVVRTDLQTQLSVQSGDIMARVSSQYATRTEMGLAVAGNITLQIPYTVSNGVAHFRAIVYRSTENVTNEFVDGAFEWYIKSESVNDREPLGSGKTMDVNINRARYGMAVVCRFSITSEPDYWTDHNGTVITDHEGTAFTFATVRAVLEAESNVYQPEYTESRFSQLEMTDSEIRLEVSRKINDETARSLISQTADAISAEVTRASAAEGTLRSSINQTAQSITQEVTRATGAENTLSSRITQTADSIQSEVTRATNAEGTLSSRITQTTDSITSEVTRAKGAENSLSSRITQTANSLSSEITNRKNADSTLSTRIEQTESSISAEVTRAKGAENTLSSRVTLTEQGLETKITSGQAQTLINASASAIRLQTTTLTWSAANSTLTESGVLITRSNAGTINERSTRLKGGQISFYKQETETGGIFPVRWGSSGPEGTMWVCGKNAGYSTMAYETSQGTNAAVFLVNNNLNPYSATEKAIICFDTYIRGQLRMSGGLNINGYTISATADDLYLTGGYVTIGTGGGYQGYMLTVYGDEYVTGKVSAASLVNRSDERMKDVIEWDDRAEDLIMALEPIMFRWNNREDGKIHAGFGAQTTVRLIEETGCKADGVVEHDTLNDEYGMAYTELIPMLVKTIQKQERRIAELEARLEKGGL